uniref:Xylanolytic transcriptional activator regulatory domain-containing protein n=1 Tax=Moniliophthora roreri TaxID=221103 RepID=A0A0W0EX90_MONRR
MSSNVSSRRDKQNLHYIIRSGLAGGVAGCVAKTVVAPLDRVKILFQASNPDFQKYAGTWSGVFRAGSEIYRSSGIRGLLQGHSVTLLRIFPYAAIKFMAYDQIHHFLMPTRQEETNFRRFSAGAISGMISVFFTYPLEVFRVRLAYHTKSLEQTARPSLLKSLHQIYHENASVSQSSPREAVADNHLFKRFPILKFYRGFTATIVGMIPYAGVSFLSWGYLRSRFITAENKKPTLIQDLTIGAVSGALAQTASYPFEVIRRRMQVGGISRPDRWVTWGETFRAIWHANGWRGFYVGLSIGYLKVPFPSISSRFVIIREVSRPAPARPPDHGGLRTSADSEAKIKELSERIVMLERSLEQQKVGISGTSDYADRAHFRSPSASSTGARSPSIYLSDLSPNGFLHDSPYSSPEPQSQEDDDDSRRVTVTREGYESAWSLLHDALGHRKEFIGNRGAWELLHSGLKDGSTTPKFIHSSLTEIASVTDGSNRYSYTPSLSIEELTQRIPSSDIVSLVLSVFFTEVNWNFGLPEHWLRTAVMQMWNILRFPDIPGSRLNAPWLSLLFTIIACTPRLDMQLVNSACLDSPEQHAIYAQAALRLAEEAFSSPTPLSHTTPFVADGAVLACLSVPLLCSYHAKNGTTSESWRLLGTWIRIAQSLGMHCDPEKYGGPGMLQEEKCLRKLAWCNLMTWERFSALILGRPQITGIELPGFASAMLSNPDGASNFIGIYQSALIRLSNIAGEINTRCISVDRPSPKTVHDVDDRLEQWRTQLPFEYRIRSGDNLELNASSLTSTLNFRQWYTLSTWYLYARMRLHLGYVTGEKENFQYFPPFPPYMSRRQSRAICTGACIELLRLQCDTVEMLCRVKTEANPRDAVYLHWDTCGPIALLEAAIGLISLMALKSLPEQSVVTQAEAALARTIQTLSLVRLQAREGNRLSETAVTVLTSLIRETGTRKGTPLSRAHSSPPAPGPSTLPSRNNPECLTFSGQSEAWKYDWYSNLSTITPPTVNMFAHSNPPDGENYGEMPVTNSHSSDLFHLVPVRILRTDLDVD